MDGPVVKAARAALERANVNLILPYVPGHAEDELRRAFERAIRVRSLSPEAKETVDYWFFETAVRLHRQGEGAPYTGLKPAGLDEGPVVPRAEKAVETGDLEQVTTFLCQALQNQLHERFHAAITRKHYDENDVAAAREYVEAYLGFVVYAHSIYTAMTAAPHEHSKAGEAALAGHRH
jgi:hypothetical protein